MKAIYLLHGLSKEEYEKVVAALGREPNHVEMGILGALWSEHCSYKSSKRVLRRFPTQGERVIQGPGENAGVVELDENVWLAFKIESHNHPSYIEPFHGAATGVGGIIRDILSMGARPIALMNSLRFGYPIDSKTKYILKGVVSGISYYGNCVGIPNVGGETYFHECYKTNPLVNAFCLGIIPAGKMLRARATKEGQKLILIGSATGRDGIHGAVMASGEFGEDTESKRPNVQIGDPYFGKKLIEAILEMIDKDLIVGLQDLGAAGLSGSASELASKSKMGVVLQLDNVPLREEGMNPYEILLSESQERMLIVADDEKVDEILSIAKRHHLEAAQIGYTTKDGFFRAYFKEQTVAELPVSLIVEEAPQYNRPSEKPDYVDELQSINLSNLENVDIQEAFFKLLESPNIASKEWIYTQYDYQVGTNTVIKPGADAAVLRVKWAVKPELKSDKLVALTCEGNGRMTYLDPEEGGKYLVAEIIRNLACVGAKALGITDCLNFGNPERPHIMWQLEKVVEGIATTCEFFGVPVVSGNVSLYNETVEVDETRNVYPTPILVGVGAIEGNYVNHLVKDKSELLFLIGDLKGEPSVAGSEFLQVVHNQVAGKLKPIDLEKEKVLCSLLIELIQKDLIVSAHDISLGGLAIALAEKLIGTGLGAEISLYVDTRFDFFLFSEDPTKVVVSVSGDKVQAFKEAVENTGLDWLLLGNVRDDYSLIIRNYDDEVLKVDLKQVENVWKRALEKALFYTH